MNVPLATRPGWTSLRDAADQLHAAELLVRDPLAIPATAVPHLREFWRAIAAAGNAAGIRRDPNELEPVGNSDDPQVWLAAELPGVDAARRQALIRHLRALDAESPPSKRELRAQVIAARSLLAALEPEIGGVPLYRRKRQILWASVATAVIITPLALYIALHAEVPGTGPWRAAYHPDKQLEGQPVVVREDDVDHDWKDTAPLEQIAPDKYSVRWDTCLQIDASGPAVFQLDANDGARLIIDGETVIDRWEREPGTRRRGFGSAELELSAGIHHVRVEYFESLGAAHVSLVASLAGSVPSPLPRAQLRYPGDALDDQDPCAAFR